MITFANLTKSARWSTQIALADRRGMTSHRRDRVLRSKGRACYLCGATAGPFDMEHPVAIGLGGSDSDEVLQPVCALGGRNPCHRDKTSRDQAMIHKARRLNRNHFHGKPKSQKRMKPGRSFQRSRASVRSPQVRMKGTT